MISEANELLELIESGKLREHTYPNVQLKQSWHQDNGKQLCGRANDLKYPSSWMVIGVSDNGELNNRDEDWVIAEEEKISSHINQYLDPGMACTKLQCHNLAGTWIVVISVSNPGTVVRWNGKPYKSAGTTAAEMHADEAMELVIKMPGLQDYSAQHWSGRISTTEAREFSTKLMSIDRVTGAISSTSSNPETILEEIGIRNKNASRILFGDSTCRLIAYDAADAVILNTTVSPLAALLSRDFQDSLSHIGRRNPTYTPLWPRLALSEGLANAVAHATYIERGGDLIIEIHPKHLSISNLCMREALAFANKWFSKSHSSTNTLLMEALRLAGYVDELGRGKQLIMREFLIAGLPPPQVTVESAGRFSRWRLVLPTAESNSRVLRLLERLKKYYDGEDRKSLLALALCLWKSKPLAEIKKCADDDTDKLFNNILGDLNGPIFHSESTDTLLLSRWARLILEEGLDSKQLSPGEEDRLYKFVRTMQTRYHAGVITPKRLRELAEMGDAAGEKKLSSLILKRWELAGYVERQGKGRFKFLDAKPALVHTATLPPPT